ncbi:MAG: ribosome silencing factor [Marinicellaceae bacterium]
MQESKTDKKSQAQLSGPQDADKIKNIIITAIEDAKGNDTIAIEVGHLTQVTDHMVITSGTSNRHIQTIAETAMKAAEEAGFEKIGIEGLGKSEWVVVDFADVVLHIMSPAAREHYNIEGLWDINPEVD